MSPQLVSPLVSVITRDHMYLVLLRKWLGPEVLIKPKSSSSFSPFIFAESIFFSFFPPLLWSEKLLCASSLLSHPRT